MVKAVCTLGLVRFFLSIFIERLSILAHRGGWVVIGGTPPLWRHVTAAIFKGEGKHSQGKFLGLFPLFWAVIRQDNGTPKLAVSEQNHTLLISIISRTAIKAVRLCEWYTYSDSSRGFANSEELERRLSFTYIKLENLYNGQERDIGFWVAP